RPQVANVRLQDVRLDPLFPQLRIAARVALEVVDARDLEPDEVDRVVDDPLRVGLGEPRLQLGREAEAVHPPSLRARGVGAKLVTWRHRTSSMRGAETSRSRIRCSGKVRSTS